MTTRPVARSTAMTDHVANAEPGRKSRDNQGNQGSFHGRNLKPSFCGICAFCGLRCAMRIARTSVGVILMALLVAPVSAGAQTPTFAKDVAPIFYSKCVECHRPTMFAPMSLVKFDDARPWAKSIRNRVSTRTMPPWGADPEHGVFKNDPRLSRQGDRDHPGVGRRRRAEGRRQGPADAAVVRRRLDHRPARRRVRDEGGVPDSGDRHGRLSIHPHSDRPHRRQVARGDRDQAAGARARASRDRLHAAGRLADQ